MEQKAKITKSPTSSEDLDEPIAVFKNVYDENYDSPGYVLDENNNLVFSRMVNEEYAWENDVYVIGSEENIANKPTLPKIPDPDPGNGGGNPPPPPNQYRTEGRSEYGGKIQVTDRNAIEHWTAGKFEFRVIVVSADRTLIKNKEFPQRACSNFKDKKWYDFNEFYFNWNQSNWSVYICCDEFI